MSFFLGNIGQENVFYNLLEEKNACLPYKNNTFKKSEKLRIFQRGYPMVFVKKWPLFHVFFQAIQARKMCFTIFQKKKTPVQPIKTTRSKSRKIEIFPKGLTHGFAQKYGHFSMSSFQAIQARKICFTIFYNEKTFFQAIKKRSLKSKKN